MSQAYYRKWRPQDWDAVIGQDHVVRTLRSALAQGNLAHAYLFSGPRGTGKTTTARIIAKAVNCLAEEHAARPCNQCAHCLELNQGRFLDLIEIDAASNTSVDDVRDLREKINYSPSKGRYKVYIIDEVHMLSNAAFNALLKTLEEPPAHAIFVLATTEVHKIPATVLSRCQRHEFRRIPVNSIQALLKEIAEQEGVQVEAAALTAIARQATGSMRDAVSLLDQLASTGTQVSLDLTRQVLGTAASAAVYEVLEAVLAQNAGHAISLFNQALDGGSDPRQFARQMVDVLRALLLVRVGNAQQLEASAEEMEKMKALSGLFSLEKLLAAIQTFDRAAQQPSLGWQPGLQLELALARLAAGEETKSQPPVPVQQVRSTVPPPSPVVKKLDLPSKSPQVLQKEKVTNSTPASLSPSRVEAAVSTEPQAPAAEPVPVDAAPAVSDPHPAPEPAGGDDLSRIQAAWKEIRTAAKELSAETGALLNSCRMVSARKGRLVLGFSSELLRSKMENGHNQENARQAIQQVTGVDILIDCRVAGKEEPSVPDGIEKDGMVGEALSLGGKIVKKE